jgi:hypothetical protein
MGGAVIGYHDHTNGPTMCYNAANFWQLGWFADRSITVDLFTPTKLRVAAFVDYDKTIPGEYVVVRTGNVYIHYNRAKGINAETGEYKDYLTIYQSINEDTFLFATLSYPDKPTYQRTFPGSGTWHAKICARVDEGNQYYPDYMDISIGFGDPLC